MESVRGSEDGDRLMWEELSFIEKCDNPQNLPPLKFELVYHGARRMVVKETKPRSRSAYIGPRRIIVRLIDLAESLGLEDSLVLVVCRALVKYLQENVFQYMTFIYPHDKPLFARFAVNNFPINGGMIKMDIRTLLALFQNIANEISCLDLCEYPIVVEGSFIRGFPFFVLAREGSDCFTFDYIQNDFIRHFHSEGIEFKTVTFVPGSYTKYFFPLERRTDEDIKPNRWRLLLVKPHQLIEDCFYFVVLSNILLE